MIQAIRNQMTFNLQAKCRAGKSGEQNKLFEQ